MPLIVNPAESNLQRRELRSIRQEAVLPRKETEMPEKETIERAREDEREGKSPSTQAGEFVREELRHIREGKHGARSPRQAIAIGLSKARRAGVKLAAPKKGKASAATRKKAEREYEKGQSSSKRKPSGTQSCAVRGALQREGRSSASHRALSRHAESSARKRGSTSRKQAARKAVRTKGRAGLRQAARKAARTRGSHRAGR
jgi:hypothetical protein